MNIKDFYDRPDSCYLVRDTKAVAEYCKEYWSEEVSHILRIADDACRREFLFDLKWDMERTYEPVIFEKEINWFYKPGNDPEFIYQFNRHRFFICLGQAYSLTGDEKYAECFTSLLLDWIDKSHLCRENLWSTWRTIEAGLRGEYWTKAFRYFTDSPHMTDKVIDVFIKSMKEHAEYLIEKHSVLRRMSNWSILEDHGLFEIGCLLPQNKDTARYISTALSHLETEVRLQVLPDGTQWEQSPMYHNEVYNCLTDVVLLAERNPHISGNEAFKNSLSVIKSAVKGLIYANAAWIKPDRHQFLNGDSDDTDIQDLLCRGAYIFKDPVLKALGCTQLDFDNAWDLGLEGIEAYKNLSSELPSFSSTALSDSGNFYLRSGWDENANLLHFHCGTLGAGHGHSDQLHIDLVVNGEDILTDAGRYTYVAGPDRYEFKDPQAHNTITVDDKLFTICRDSWRCSKLSNPINQKFKFLPDYEFVQGGHTGYMDIPEGVMINRKIVHIKPDIYVICDELYTNGTHSYKQYFHFNESGTVTLKASSAELTIAKPSTEAYYFGEKYILKPSESSIEYNPSIQHPEACGSCAEYLSDKNSVKIFSLAPGLKSSLSESRISRTYNKAETRKVLVNEFSGTGFCSAFTIICTQKNGSASEIKVKKVQVDSVFNREIHPDYYAEALNITLGYRDYVVIICHQEVNSPTDQTGAAGCMGFGNVIVFDKNKEQQPGTVLLY